TAIRRAAGVTRRRYPCGSRACGHLALQSGARDPTRLPCRDLVVVLTVEDDLQFTEELGHRVLDGCRPEPELLTQLAELLLDRTVADDRHRRRVPEPVSDRRLVVEDLLRQRVEFDAGEVRGRGR